MRSPIELHRFPLSGGWVLYITDHFAIWYGRMHQPRLIVRFYR